MNLKWFLLCVPAAFAASWMGTSPILVFCLSALAMIPLAQLMGDATEDLAHYLGPSAGGLLTATMGNIPDIIISIFALRHGLVEVVKASITGAIVGNLLLGVGLTCLLGGLKHRAGQTFDIKSSHLMSGLLLLSTIGLIIPAIFNFSTDSEKQISLEISVVLLVTYLSSVYFTLRNPQSEIQVPIISVPEEDQLDPTQRSFGQAALLLGVSTLVLAGMSEVLTDAIEPAAKMMGFTPIFTGIFLLAPLGASAEVMNAVRFGLRNKLDLALASCIGSSTQTALLTAPIMVFVGMAIHQPMELLFSEFQVVAVFLAVGAVNNILNIGTVRWISGVKLIAVYLMLGIGFYYQP